MAGQLVGNIFIIGHVERVWKMVCLDAVAVREFSNSRNAHLDECAVQVDLLLATPLKLVRLLKKGRLQLSNVRFLVCDEVDKLLSDQSMIKQVDTIIAACKHPKRVSRPPCLAAIPAPSLSDAQLYYLASYNDGGVGIPGSLAVVCDCYPKARIRVVYGPLWVWNTILHCGQAISFA
jgi:hypothetical protein